MRNPYGAGAPYGPADSADDYRATLDSYLRLVLKRRWLIVSIALVLLTVGVTRTLMETPLYVASVRIQIDREAAKIVENNSINQSDIDVEGLRTQFEVLKSRSMAERVVSTLQLADDLDFFKPRDFSFRSALRSMISGGQTASAGGSKTEKAAREEWAVGIVASNLGVRPVPGSRLVDIVYTDPSPARSARIANAYADVYTTQTIDKRFKANEYARTFLDDQSKQLQIRLQESETALLKFSEDQQIIVLNEKSSIAETNLSAANNALSTLTAERIRQEQIWRQVENEKGLDLPQFLTNGVVQTLRAAKKALETEYQEKLQTFKPAYPAMVEISMKIRETDRQLANEIRSIKMSLRAAYEAAVNQENETKAQIEGLRTEVLDLQKKLIQYNILKREVDTNRSLYNGLLQRLKEVEVAGGVGTNNVFIIDRATVPGGPATPNLSRAVMLWLSLGLGLGFAAAFGMELFDDKIRSPEDLEKIAGYPTLGVIPNLVPGAIIEQEIADPRSISAEAYRSLCTSLQFSTDKGLPKTILVTSAGPSEGKSITAVAISRHFSSLKMKVLLIDADLRNPSLHSKLGTENVVGLSNYLTGGMSPPDLMLRTDIESLAFMPTGPLPPNAADLLSSSRLHSLLALGLQVFDLIVVDGPPVMGLADAQLLSSATTGTIFVAAAGQAKSGAVRRALKRMELARAPIIGCVMTKFDTKSASYVSGYDYSYGYGGHSESGTGRSVTTTG